MVPRFQREALGSCATAAKTVISAGVSSFTR
jgi:hypothetical protein